jgi:hypothetical protein
MFSLGLWKKCSRYFDLHVVCIIFLCCCYSGGDWSFPVAFVLLFLALCSRLFRFVACVVFASAFAHVICRMLNHRLNIRQSFRARLLSLKYSAKFKKKVGKVRVRGFD